MKSTFIKTNAVALLAIFCLSGTSIAMDNPLGLEVIGEGGDMNPQGADDIGAINDLLAGVYNDLADKSFLGTTWTGAPELNLSYLMAPEKYKIFGNSGENKITRDNTRYVLKRSESFNGKRSLNSEEISILKNLRDAIADENTLIYSKLYSAYPIKESLKEKVLAKLDQILSMVATINIDNEGINFYDNPQLVLRQSLEKVNEILIRNDNLGEAKYHKGSADLTYLLKLNPGCASNEKTMQPNREAIRQTLSKASGSIRPFDMEDIKNIQLLREAVVGAAKPVCVGGKSIKSIVTREVVQRENLVKQFEKISSILNDSQSHGIKNEIGVLDAMTVSDLPFLQRCRQDINIGIAATLQKIEMSLDNALMMPGAIAYLPVYKAKEALISHHNKIMSEIKKDQMNLKNEDILKNPILIKEIFMELTQLKIALESFSEIPFKPGTAGMVVSSVAEKIYLGGSKKIDWGSVLTQIVGDNGILYDIDLMRQFILCKLANKEEIQRAVDTLEGMKLKNEQKIITLQNKKDVWILSLAGGGIRGKIAAQILEDIESKGINIVEKIDYFAGTSVGGLIVSSFNIPKPPEYTFNEFNARFVAGLLEGETAAHIFPPLTGAWKGLYQANSYAYSEYSLENLLISNFHYTPLSNMVKPTLLVASNMQTGKPVHLKSYGPESEKIYAWQAARATSAAPSYFPPMAVYYKKRITLLEDGGVTENDPTFAALNEVNNIFEQGNRNPQRINILFIGTGRITKEQNFGEGGVGLGSHAQVLEKSMDRNSKVTEKLVKERIKLLRSMGIIVNYYYLNPQLMEAIELDDSSEPNLAKLRKAASDIIASPYYKNIIESLRGMSDDGASKYVNIWGPGQDQFKVTNID